MGKTQRPCGGKHSDFSRKNTEAFDGKNTMVMAGKNIHNSLIYYSLGFIVIGVFVACSSEFEDAVSSPSLTSD